MYSILVIPNITYSQNLEADSYVVVLKNVIQSLAKIRKDLQWTVISPSPIQSLMLPNVTQSYLEIPSYPNTMRCHFNTREFLNAVNFKENDYDVVYSHLPEWNSQIKNVIGNSTNIRPKYISYCHWFEVPENTNYNETLFPQNLLGILETEETGVNSMWLKNLVLEKAAWYFSSNIISELERKIQPHYLGIDSIDFSEEDFNEKTILFNSRDDSYTGFGWFIEEMDKLWKKRQDFKVITTIANIKRPYLGKIQYPSRQSYLDIIRKIHLHVGCFEGYSAWSIATTDALSRGVPSLLPNNFCYPEMLGADYPLLYNGRKEFMDKLVDFLDTPTRRQEMRTIIKPIMEDFLWEKRVPTWFNNWEFLNQKFAWEAVGHSEGYLNIQNIIQSNKQITKKTLIKKLGWGKGIPWSPYRNRLRMDGVKCYKNGFKI